MDNKILICFILFIIHIIHICTAILKDNSQDSTNPFDLNLNYNLTAKATHKSDCWMTLNAPVLFNALEELDNKYKHTLKTVQDDLILRQFDDEMLQAMISSRGAANREINKSNTQHIQIPAGMNFGGRCMLRMPYSVLFFHRLKLCNDTHFRVNVLHNDIKNMVLRAHLSLNHIRLQGAYERAMTPGDPSFLQYAPSFGEVQLLLSDVQYEVQGRYRVIKGRLIIEHILSQLKVQDIMTTFNTTTDTKNLVRLQKENIADFLGRLKADLNKWLKDYLNDYLMFINLLNVPGFGELQTYDNVKALHLAAYTDNAINAINKRLKNIGGDRIKVPSFSIVSPQNLHFNIFDGEIRGLDTMYRRSVATTILKRDNLRYVDATVGFSDLKVIYKYETDISPNNPHNLSDYLILSTNDISSHLTLGLLKDPEVVEINIDHLEPLGPRSLMLREVANFKISKFKYLLQNHIFTIMANTLTYGVAMLKSLPRCEPFVPGQIKPKHKLRPIIEDSDEVPEDTVQEAHIAMSSRETNTVGESKVLRQKAEKHKNNSNNIHAHTLNFNRIIESTSNSNTL